MNSNSPQWPTATSRSPHIPTMEHIRKIRKNLITHPRDLLLFDIATQTGLNMNDILQIKTKALLGVSPNEELPIGSGSVGGRPRPVMTQVIQQSFQSYLEHVPLQPDDFLFASRKGGRPLNISSISNLIKSWFRAVGLDGLTGSRTLKSTYHAFFKSQPSGETDKSIPGDRLGGLEPIRAESTPDLVYRELLRNIVSGRISPGERLITNQISRRLKVGPSSVREALNRLLAAGFVSSPQNRVLVVNQLSKDNLEEILSIRLQLELMAGRAAARIRNDAVLAELEKAFMSYQNLILQYEVEKALGPNKVFHFTIYEAAGMSILLQHIQMLWNRVSPYLYLLTRKFPDYDETIDVEFHREMLEGMKGKDPEQVAHGLEKDLTHTGRWIIDHFDAMKKGWV